MLFETSGEGRSSFMFKLKRTRIYGVRIPTLLYFLQVLNSSGLDIDMQL